MPTRDPDTLSDQDRISPVDPVRDPPTVRTDPPSVDGDPRRGSSDPRAARRPVEKAHRGDWGESDTIPDLRDLPRGAMVGEYRIRRKLEEGGMGTVYAAIHPIIERKVAIKVLHAGLSSDQNVVKRFILEARAACRIGHPGIVDVFGFGQLPDGRHYIIMEYLHGQQLLSLLRERAPLPFEISLPILRGICEPLEVAHQNNIVHRDLKPENVFLVPRPDGEWPPRVKVLDFGLAKLLEPHRPTMTGPTTKTGTTLGTCYYMAPEQCRGQPVDARSDIYSLGVMMYEMMTGRVPFYSTSSVEVMFMHLREQPEPPSQHAQIDTRVEKLILDCMAKKPEDRPQTMGDVLKRIDELEAALKRPVDPLAKEIAAVAGSLIKHTYAQDAPTESQLMPQVTEPSKVAPAAPSASQAQAQSKSWLVPALVSVSVVLAVTLAIVLYVLFATRK